jgi:hypothetical protein
VERWKAGYQITGTPLAERAEPTLPLNPSCTLPIFHPYIHPLFHPSTLPSLDTSIENFSQETLDLGVRFETANGMFDKSLIEQAEV